MKSNNTVKTKIKRLFHQQTSFYGHHTGHYALVGMSSYEVDNFAVASFTVHMYLLKATITFGLGRNALLPVPIHVSMP